MAHRRVLAWNGGEVVKKAVAVFVMVVLSFAAACAPSAPTPTRTPEPTPTPVEVLATKPEHLEGIWFNTYYGSITRGVYYRIEADGTIYWAYTLEDLQENPDVQARFWFEDGVYYEEGYICAPIGCYRAYLEIEEGRAVGLRFEDPSCFERRREKRLRYVRVD
jgi:hypothetical protein